jgi:hypothetical protein
MTKQNQHVLPADLARARARLAAWRRTKKPRSRIPETLWNLAVKLTGQHGLNRTARTLKLDYYSLKKRVDASGGQGEKNDPAFVEFPSPLAPTPECVIELDKSAGTLRVHLKGYSATDIATVGRSLRGWD